MWLLTSMPAARQSDMHRSEFSSYQGRGWRVVEAQHKVATMKLADTLDDQALLESLIEASKPPLPEACHHLDYLLAAPFRYKPYPNGSRFRRAGHSPGVFYAAQKLETALAEAAFYRLLFFAESPATPMPRAPFEVSVFAAALGTSALLDLTVQPYAAQSAQWTHPTDYTTTQALEGKARAAGAQIIRYQSCRCPKRGANIAVLACSAFARPAPVARQSWWLNISQTHVQARCEHPDRAVEFARAWFATDPRLA
ncbi:MAG: RES family NAD+ phosphorylase [Paracoccaceae bacterium]